MGSLLSYSRAHHWGAHCDSGKERGVTCTLDSPHMLLLHLLYLFILVGCSSVVLDEKYYNKSKKLFMK